MARKKAKDDLERRREQKRKNLVWEEQERSKKPTKSYRRLPRKERERGGISEKKKEKLLGYLN